MPNHFALSESLLIENNELRKRLDTEHAREFPRQKVVASLYDRIRHNTATARVHSNLAVAQAIHDQTGLATS